MLVDYNDVHVSSHAVSKAHILQLGRNIFQNPKFQGSTKFIKQLSSPSCFGAALLIPQ